MARRLDTNFKKHRVLIALLVGIVGSMSLSLLSPDDTFATSCGVDTPYPCVSATFGELTGKTTATPGENRTDKLYFTMPLSITMNGVKNYSITLSDSNHGALKSGSHEIPSVASNTSWSQLGVGKSEWGMRATLGTVDDGTKDFRGILDSTSLASHEVVTSLRPTNIDYILGFGVAVDGSTAAGSYTDVITVSVVAEPRDMTIFDISNMQDMTTEICKATPTPTTTATQSTGTKNITWGAEVPTTLASVVASGWDKDKTVSEVLSAITNKDAASGNQTTTVVPETFLQDTRDGKYYLVRKLADGNCWMSQNLELDILGNSLIGQQNGTRQDYYSGETQGGVNDSNHNDNVIVTADNYFGDQVVGNFILTANDTDLNSTSIWTTDYFAKTYNKISTAKYVKVYATMNNTNTATDYTRGWANNGNDGMRSYNVAASNGDWNYSTEVDPERKDSLGRYIFSNSATGTPYARRGSFYNWAATTLGSGLDLTEDRQQAQDSICPKGWQLPVSGGQNDLTSELNTVTDKSFTKILRTYIGHLTTNSSSHYNRISEWPLQFMRPGQYGRADGAYQGHGRLGSWWSSISGVSSIHNPTDRAYVLSAWQSTDTSYVSSFHTSWRGMGFSVRCVAR